MIWLRLWIWVFWRQISLAWIGAFAILRKATISIVIFVCPSVRPHGTTEHPLCGFLYNLMFEYFSKISRRNSSLRYNHTRISGTLHEDQCTSCITSRSILLRMRNVSDKSCTENQNTHFVFSNFSRKSCRLWDNVEKYCRAGQATDDSMARAHCMLDT